MKASKKRSGPEALEKEMALQFADSAVLRVLLGEQDQNLKLVEKELDVQIGSNGGGLVISGMDAQVELAHDLLSQLKGLIEKGERIFPGDLQRSIQMLAGNRKLRLEEVYRDQIQISGRRYNIVPKTPTQKNYIEAIRANDIVFGVGPAGTGKTYLGMAMAVAAVLNREVKRVVLCRPAVEAGEKLGFLPGDMAEKVNPYLRPLYDALHDMVEPERALEMVERGTIEVAPLAFMRGRTLSSAFVILDEAQNTTVEQMKMLLTRLGPDSKLVVTGDPSQIDLPRGLQSGLIDAMNVLKAVEGICFVSFNETDVLRHQLVGKIVRAYRKREEHEPH